ncbi:DinB family protein [Paenibacillus glycinis]|uniref:DinB family protein n=1 Tax=Paenibacillus glycinis TaxID=2697035 RepID=A0ABW9XQK2_9BACL|nr:DinB family protein [Paenibacillus glycinis]NBD24919.1 DinB family protein [Paenibacillus glycinis]
MNAQKLINQLEVIREMTIKSIPSITDEMADEMPAGYRNTVRWHLGHIAAFTDLFLSNFAGLTPYLSEAHISMFKSGSKPADWGQTQPPTLEELATLLKGQMEHIKSQFGTKNLEEKANKPLSLFGTEMDSIGEILNFSFYHEGQHLGHIKCRTSASPLKQA